jgi:hypothetical protein
MDETGDCYGKLNQLDIERQVLHDLTHMWNLKQLISWKLRAEKIGRKHRSDF